MNQQTDISSNNFLSGVTESLLKTDNRELTIVASSICVITLMLLGSCIWCVTHFCRKRRIKKASMVLESDESSQTKAEEPLFEGWKADTNGSVDKPNINGSGVSANSKAKYKNIIRPDKSIEFVIPTIQMPAQPIAIDRDACLDPEFPTCSKTLSISQHSIPKDFYPQLEIEDCPKVGFVLYFEASTQILYVRLLGGRHMPGDVRHCVTVKLYPGRGGKQKSRDFEEISPIYNQEFCFHIRKSTLCTRILRFKAVILDTPKKVIGCLNLALKAVPGFGAEDTTQDLQSTPIWKILEQSSESSAEGIRLRVSLKWQEEPPPGLLTLKVIEATGLHGTSENDYTSSHVKVSLQEQGRTIKSRKTRLVRWGSVPSFEDTFVVSIPHDLLGQISFLLEVIARGRLGSKVILGKISIGSIPFCPSTDGLEFWEDCIHGPNIEVTRWLQLVS